MAITLPLCVLRSGTPVLHLRLPGSLAICYRIYRTQFSKCNRLDSSVVTALSSSTRPVLESFTARCFHSTNIRANFDKEKPKQLMIYEELFNAHTHKDKSTFLLALQTFSEHNSLRRNHMEFIYTAMKHLQEHGVHKDLDVYKQLMSVLPPGRFVPENWLQVAFFHFFEQQMCAISLLDKMESNGVCPDLEMKKILVDRFGDRGRVIKKFARMLYWFPKFKHLSPFPLPETIPNDSLEVAKLAVARMMVDLQSSITIFQTENLHDSLDKTWIVSGLSPSQQELISKQEDNVPFYVEGPYLIWLKESSITYFTLIAENTFFVNTNEEEEDPDDVSNLESVILNPGKVKELVPLMSVHEQEDGVVLALCATGTSSRDSLLSWIRFLQEDNPRLKTNPVLFTLKAPSKELVTMNQKPVLPDTVDSKVVQVLLNK